MEAVVRTIWLIAVSGVVAAGVGCGGGSASGAPTPAEAKQFLESANDTLKRVGIEQNQAGWIAQTYITDDTEALDARINQEAIAAVARLAKASTRFDSVSVSADERRQLDLLKLSLVMATPSDTKEAKELTQIMARLEATYGKGTWCDPEKPDRCLKIDDITKIMSESRNEAELRKAWEGRSEERRVGKECRL